MTVLRHSTFTGSMRHANMFLSSKLFDWANLSFVSAGFHESGVSKKKRKNERDSTPFESFPPDRCLVR